MSKNEIIKIDTIKKQIYTIREQQVMIDRDLADLYHVETKVLNQAVKRNIERFPDAFRFQLNDEEKNELVTNCDRFESLKHSTSNPFAFTEQGVSMLSAVLTSDIAIEISIQIMNAFVEMRKFILSNAGIFSRLDKIEQNQIKYDENFERLFNAIEEKEITPQKGIFYDGQIYDAHKFVSDIIKNAKQSIIIIDNYIDDTVLTQLTRKKKSVHVIIYTQRISKQLTLDAEKFNAQYPSLKLKTLSKSHDRFIIIDEKTVYHIGASLKDLGKKWFGFSKFDKEALGMIDKL